MKRRRDLTDTELELIAASDAGLTILDYRKQRPAAQALPFVPEISEADFMAQIIALAKENCWLVYHTTDSRKSQAGFLDLVLVREHVLWWECKTETGKLDAAQQTWLEALQEAGQSARVVRPSDWPVVVAILAAPRKSADGT